MNKFPTDKILLVFVRSCTIDDRHNAWDFTYKNMTDLSLSKLTTEMWLISKDNVSRDEFWGQEISLAPQQMITFKVIMENHLSPHPTQVQGVFEDGSTFGYTQPLFSTLKHSWRSPVRTLRARLTPTLLQFIPYNRP